MDVISSLQPPFASVIFSGRRKRLKQWTLNPYRVAVLVAVLPFFLRSFFFPFSYSPQACAPHVLCHETPAAAKPVCSSACVRRRALVMWPPYVIGQAIIFLPCGFFLMIALCNRADHYIFILWLLLMAALHSICGHYIFALWCLSFYLSIFSSPNLSGRRFDVYHTSTYGVALVRI